jgi:hypothetical protein
MDNTKKQWESPTVEVFGDVTSLTQTLKVCGDDDNGILIQQPGNAPCGSSILP